MYLYDTKVRFPTGRKFGFDECGSSPTALKDGVVHDLHLEDYEKAEDDYNNAKEESDCCNGSGCHHLDVYMCSQARGVANGI